MAQTCDKVIVIVPGAFHVPYHWHLLRDRLEEDNYEVDVLHLPSVGNDPPPQVFDEDVQTIRSAIKKHADAGKDVVLLAHSYGGVPVTEAAFGHGKAASNSTHQGRGGVVALIYLCAFMLREGESVNRLASDLRLVGYPDKNGNGVLHAKNPREAFYNDLPSSPSSLADAAIAHLQPMAQSHVFAAPRHCAWRAIPTAYIFCERDNALPAFAQRMMVERARREDGVSVESVVLDSDHSPFLGMPGRLAEVLGGLIRELGK